MNINVLGSAVNQAQVASNANRALAYKKTFADYLKKLGAAVDAAGL